MRVSLFGALALGLLLAAPAEAKGKKRAYRTYKQGDSARRAFRSLARHRAVRPIYRAKKKQRDVRHAVNEGLWPAGVAPIAAGNVMMGGHFAVKYGGMLADAISRGNTVEIVGAAAVTALVGAFTAGNVWLGRACIKSARTSFAAARAKRRAARKETVRAVIESSALQRRLNGGRALPAAEVRALRSLSNAL